MSEFLEINNPYTLQFSFIPPQFIKRSGISKEIIENFVRAVPTYRGMFITGVRGSGKTVILSDIRKQIESLDNWVTVDLNPESDLLDSLARGLYLKPAIKALFLKAKLDFSLLGIGVHIEKAELIASNPEDALKMMLTVLRTAGKKVLVTIDEVTYSKDVAKFSHALSSYAGEGFDIFVLMTGLVENINAIKNKKSLTFLYRAKVRQLDELNRIAVRSDYENTLGLNIEQAGRLSELTKGYSLAFQAVGFHYWNALCHKPFDKIIHDEVRKEIVVTLAELAYDKIWDELSATDIKILRAMNELKPDEDGFIRVENIRNTIEMSSDSFTRYRKRLLDSGIIDGKRYGYLRFVLPEFEEYIQSVCS